MNDNEIWEGDRKKQGRQQNCKLKSRREERKEIKCKKVHDKKCGLI